MGGDFVWVRLEVCFCLKGDVGYCVVYFFFEDIVGCSLWIIKVLVVCDFDVICYCFVGFVWCLFDEE